MKAFIITNSEIDESYSTARRHLTIMKNFEDFKPEIFNAVIGAAAYDLFKDEGIKFLDQKYWSPEFKERNEKHNYQKRPGIAGCFASHYLLWNKSVELNDPIGIFEYDAIQVRKMPKDYEFNELLYLSSWRNMNGTGSDQYNDHLGTGVQNYIGYDAWGYHNVMSGAHAYLIKPETAKILIGTTLEKG